MANPKISVDLSALGAQVKDVINKQVFPLLNQAVRAVAAQTSINWKASVMQAKLWQGEKDQYVSSISWRMTGDFSAVVEATYKYAQEIETGRPARDLKAMLGTSTKVRVSKKGVRYMYIPLRHNTPGNSAHAPAMPQNVYDLAKDMATSSIIGQTTRQSGLNASSIKTKKFLTTKQNVYQWGGRLPAGLAAKLKPEHKTDIYAGMVKMKANTPGATSSVYLTFRTMSEKSKGWIVAPKPGLYLAKQVSEQMQPLAQNAFAEAIKRTLKS